MWQFLGELLKWRRLVETCFAIDKWELLMANPLDPESLMQLGNEFYICGDYDKAQALYKQSQEIF